MRAQTPESSGKQGDSDTYIDLQDAFDRAAQDGRGDGDDDGDGDSESRSPRFKSASRHRGHRYKHRGKNKATGKHTDRDR